MSSKLMDAGAMTDAVPWMRPPAARPGEPAGRIFESVSTGPQYRSDAPGGAESQPPGSSHADPQRRIEGLEQEVIRLESRIGEATRAGYLEGFDVGVEQESAKWAEAFTRMSRTIAELSAIKPRLRAQVEEDAVRLSLAIARKILRREVTVDPSSIAGLLRVALEKANSRDVLRVRASPWDAADLSSRLSSFGLPTQVEVQADPALERGSLVVDTTKGHIDASVETQLLEIERGLADALGRKPGL